ncbi:MAG: SGNH/GDSL hydrolase family protein [Micropruina sp.]
MRNFAVTGATTQDVLTQQIPTALVTGQRPSLITLMAGANDISYGACLLALIGASATNPCTPEALAVSLPAMGQSLAATLVALRTSFPEAQIVVVQYFNPMPKPGAVCKAMTPLLEAKLLFGDQDPAGFIGSVTDGSTADVAAFQAQIYAAAQAVVSGLNSTVEAAAGFAGAATGGTIETVKLPFNNHDFCRDYYSKSPAWVLAPKIMTEGSITLPTGAVMPVGTTADPRHACTAGLLCTQSPNPDIYLSLPQNPYGITYAIALWVNDFPHLTPAGNAAIAKALAKQVASV